MSSHPKKSSGKASVVAAPVWHPNFRIVQRLPDTKPIRTIFFINSAAVMVAVGLALYIGYYEVGLRALRTDTDSAISELGQNKPASDEAVALYANFKEQESRVLALQGFLAARKLVVSDFILHLGASLPPSVRLSSIDYRAANIVLRGDITGAADEASGLVYTYIDLLRKDKELGELFSAITLNNVARDPGTGHIRFEAGLTYKGAPVKAKGGKK